ncbi:murein L,D-transpeptidase catalytic domain family protein [Aurantiacibacter aquimixticola]|uniref:Twin-arginine translocation pathway signal n=1 Tax=Aurantiacibacter aquimixticola TaxID=1958945 RepID=A0A419RTY6_9SPHN|nr:murein L,D-transpeptidase catalytic domain family protein [Aurantiacibacter aquimixticola]RJY09239.1 twin-arginine translocation pathway signal [Aurantiacibacter aquimixticola]
MNRRQLLTSSLAAGAVLAAPTRVFAQAGPRPQARRLLEVAAREVERNSASLWRRNIVGISDFGLHSSLPRFHIVDLDNARVDSLLVSHGSGSDPEHDGWLNGFSNMQSSWATSKGAYLTWEWYIGRFGRSVRLSGLDPTNSNAFDRAIVMHPADYSTPEHVARWGRLGRSNGCFALGPEPFRQALARLSGGCLLYADTLGIGPSGEDVARPLQDSVDFEANVARNTQRNQRAQDTDAGELARIYADANPTLTTE